MPWYSFTPVGTPDVSNPNHYTSAGSTPPSCATPKEVLCAIQAPDNGGRPNLNLVSPNIYIEISNAMVTRTESTNVKLRPF